MMKSNPIQNVGRENVKRDAVTQTLREVEELVPQVKRISGGSSLGTDTVLKVERAIVKAKEALNNGNLAALADSAEAMQRALELFRGMLSRMGGPA